MQPYDAYVMTIKRAGDWKAKPAARAVVLNPEGKVLLLKRHAHDSLHPGTWNLPGGGVDSGEDFHTAAARELHEETKLKATHAGAAPHTYTFDAGKAKGVKGEAHLYHSTGGSIKAQAMEVADHGWFHPDELPEKLFPQTADSIKHFTGSATSKAGVGRSKGLAKFVKPHHLAIGGAAAIGAAGLAAFNHFTSEKQAKTKWQAVMEAGSMSPKDVARIGGAGNAQNLAAARITGDREAMQSHRFWMRGYQPGQNASIGGTKARWEKSNTGGYVDRWSGAPAPTKPQTPVPMPAPMSAPTPSQAALSLVTPKTMKGSPRQVRRPTSSMPQATGPKATPAPGSAPATGQQLLQSQAKQPVATPTVNSGHTTSAHGASPQQALANAGGPQKQVPFEVPMQGDPPVRDTEGRKHLMGMAAIGATGLLGSQLFGHYAEDPQ